MGSGSWSLPLDWIQPCCLASGAAVECRSLRRSKTCMRTTLTVPDNYTLNRCRKAGPKKARIRSVRSVARDSHAFGALGGSAVERQGYYTRQQ